MKNNPVRIHTELSSPWFYFVLAIGWSWLMWLPAALLTISVDSTAGMALSFLGLLGPPLSGIVCTYLTRDKAGRRDYWLRIIDARRIRASWYPLVFLTAPILTALAVLLDILAGGTGGTWEEATAGLQSAPLTILPFILGLFFLGPFFEEFGWRGYVLERLQERWSALTSSLVLGVVWALWHLPLFFIRDTYQYGLGAGSVEFWFFMAGIIPVTVFYTWIFNNNHRSTLSAILFHFMVNLTGELFALTGRAETFLLALWFVAAAVVTGVYGMRSLTRGKDETTV